MKREKINIENGIVSIPQSGTIQMTVSELAELFGCYVQIVNANIKAILKSSIVKVDILCSMTVYRNTVIPDYYGLDMVITLAFRINSKNAEVFRKWLMKKASKIETPKMLIMSIQNPILN